MKRHWNRLAFAAGVVLAVLYGGAKNEGRISYPRTDPETWYLLDNGSEVRPDELHIAFTRNPIVPASANFFVEGLDVAYTNQSDWAEYSFLAYSNTLGNIVSPFDFAYPAATGCNWIVYTDWTPPPTTHTNGVAYASWQRPIDGATNRLATVKTGIYIGPVRISPPPAMTNGIAVSIGLGASAPSASTPPQETTEP